MRYWTALALILAFVPALHFRAGKPPRDEFVANVGMALFFLPPLLWFLATHWAWTPAGGAP